MSNMRRTKRLVALAVGLVLVAAACGGDDDDDAGQPPTPRQAPEATEARPRHTEATGRDRGAPEAPRPRRTGGTRTAREGAAARRRAAR